MTGRESWRIARGRVERWAAHYHGPPFHALLCDPPYHLVSIVKRFSRTARTEATVGHSPYGRHAAGFMGQTWDGGGVSFEPETWAALGEHLYPGAFGMAFASARGWHRLAVAIEDAGFVIHPSIFGWLHGQGFPKATRIDNQIGGAGAEVWKGHRYGLQALKPSLEPIIVFQKPYEGQPVEDIARTGAGALNIDGARLSTLPRLTGTRDPGASAGSGIAYKGSDGQRQIAYDAARQRAGEESDERRYDERGATDIAAKPGPRGGDSRGRWPPNFALVHLPGCEREGMARIDAPTRKRFRAGRIYGAGHGIPDDGYTGVGDADGKEGIEQWRCEPGCPVAMLDDQAGERSSGDGPVVRHIGDGYSGNWPGGETQAVYGDIGPASRFYARADWSAEIEEGILEDDGVTYVPKANVSEREDGLRGLFPCHRCGSFDSETHIENHVVDGEEREFEVRCRRNIHPTIKPIALARWLATLLLPPSSYAPRRILVPFCGVGSEMIGALEAGWECCVGIEAKAEYRSLGLARLRWWAHRIQFELGL